MRPAPTDGRDIVNGGTEGAAGDTFVINGNAAGEDLPYLHAQPRTTSPATRYRHQRRATEIVITRNGTNCRFDHRRTAGNRRNPHQRR